MCTYYFFPRDTPHRFYTPCPSRAYTTWRRFAWKRTSGYYAQTYAENVFARSKRTFGDQLRAKRDASQEREAALACQWLNRMRARGRPQSYPVS